MENFLSRYLSTRRPVVEVFHEPSLTVQSEKDSCDINSVLLKYAAAGTTPAIEFYKSYDPSAFTDNFHSGDFQAVSDRICSFTAAFNSLGSSLRARFSHDPAVFLDYLSNPANRDEGVKLGFFAPSTSPSQSAKSVDSIPSDGAQNS